MNEIISVDSDGPYLTRRRIVENVQVPINANLVDNDSDFDDTATTVSLSSFFDRPEGLIDQHQDDLDTRERQLIEREKIIQEKEKVNAAAVNTVRAKTDELKKKIDRFIEEEVHESLLIDPEIYGYASHTQPFLFMSVQDQNRLNKLRLKVNEIRTRIEQRRYQNRLQQNNNNQHLHSPSCPVCLDDIRTTDKAFFTLRCGHVHCENCLDGIIRTRINNQPAKCASCRNEFDHENNGDRVRLRLTYNQ